MFSPAQSRVMAQGDDQAGSTIPLRTTPYVQQQVQSASNPDVLVNALHKLEPGAWQRSGESEQAAAERLGRSIEVARVGTSYRGRDYRAGRRTRTWPRRSPTPWPQALLRERRAREMREMCSALPCCSEEQDRIQNELNADYAEQDALNKQLGDGRGRNRGPRPDRRRYRQDTRGTDQGSDRSRRGRGAVYRDGRRARESPPRPSTPRPTT